MSKKGGGEGIWTMQFSPRENMVKMKENEGLVILLTRKKKCVDWLLFSKLHPRIWCSFCGIKMEGKATGLREAQWRDLWKYIPNQCKYPVLLPICLIYLDKYVAQWDFIALSSFSFPFSSFPLGFSFLFFLSFSFLPLPSPLHLPLSFPLFSSLPHPFLSPFLSFLPSSFFYLLFSSPFPFISAPPSTLIYFPSPPLFSSFPCLSPL